MAAAVAVSGHWRRLRTLGRGASGAVVSLASDPSSGELFAVKSAGARDAATLRREQAVLACLSSPHVVRCVGGGEGAEGEGSYSLFLEYAPGGSLADEVARNGGSLEEPAIRAYAADVLRALAYLHGSCSVVHGDVKARNVLIGADGRAKLADFGCARAFAASGCASARRPIGGTPAFMAPEVARGEDQGPAADVWALGCTVIEMATGRAPWSDMAGDDVLAAVHRIGYTDAVPEAPFWLSPEAEDFLACCFARDPADRWTAARLLEHPFVAFACHDDKGRRWRASPKSTLDAAFWDFESESEDDDADELSGNASERIKSLASSASACSFPDWDSEEGGWIDVLSEQQQQDVEAACGAVQVSRCAPSKVSSDLAVPAGEMAVGGGSLPCDDDVELEADDVPFGGDDAPAAADASVEQRQEKHYSSSHCHVVLLSCQLVPCNQLVIINNAIKLWVPTKIFAVLLCSIPLVMILSLLMPTNFHFHRYTRDRPRSAPHATPRTCLVRRNNLPQ